jgi:hypothetical protein
MDASLSGTWRQVTLGSWPSIQPLGGPYDRSWTEQVIGWQAIMLSRFILTNIASSCCVALVFGMALR